MWGGGRGGAASPRTALFCLLIRSTPALHPPPHTRTPPPRHDKVPGDGRALVLASPDALTLRAEDGRSVRSVDISAFVNSLPKASGLDTTQFSTDCASGSTSMAAR